MTWNKSPWTTKQFICVTMGLAVGMLLFCYYAWNQSHAFGDIGKTARISAWIKRHVQTPDDNADVLAINIAYDKQLVAHYDEYGIPDGTIGVTDREKLYRLFCFLNEHPTYRYIVCDIDFNTGYTTSYDSLLFDLLSRMPRVCIPAIDEPLEILSPISYSAEYNMKSAGDGFLQYKYTIGGGPSIPVHMWEEIDHGQYEKHWYGYTRNGRLCSDGVIPDMHFSIENTYDENGQKQIYNLGADILEFTSNETGALFKDKIILIGDWTENDMHDTLRAEQPGIAILYNAYLVLRDGKNLLPWYLFLFLFILFWCVSMAVFWEKSAFLSEKLSYLQQYMEKHIILKLCLRTISIMFVLQIICILSYFIFDRYINILAIGILLTIISFFI